MFGQSDLSRTLMAAVAAVLMSSLAVGSAVGPAQFAAQAQGAIHA
ncbi:MAG TPA: hypothetical protein VM265_04550 [Sphingomicrobium sp.]|nr:hypothetical protein [Sphingomicrobium sp.]